MRRDFCAGFVQLIYFDGSYWTISDINNCNFSPIGAQHFSGITKNSKLLVNVAPVAINLILHQLSRDTTEPSE